MYANVMVLEELHFRLTDLSILEGLKFKICRFVMKTDEFTCLMKSENNENV